ncbi:MAG: hypothetical protein QUS14_12370, partial [Pyrinomonadaceae bacterium]|nr:hypothetical protein [Pyrinomonadaceae bacterium]
SASASSDGLKIRNRFTGIFLAFGVASESIAPLQNLERVLREKGCADILADPDFAPFRDFRRRWNEFFGQRLRNKAAFHFDSECIAAGAKRLSEHTSLVLTHVGPRQGECYFPVGDEAVIEGTAESIGKQFTDEALSSITTTTMHDQISFAPRLTRLLERVVDRLAER